METNETPQERRATISSLPKNVILEGGRVVLKTPTPEDDEAFRKIMSDPITVKHLPQLNPGSRTLQQVAATRERLLKEQLKNNCLTLLIHSQVSSSKSNEEQEIELIGTTGFNSIDLGKGIAEIGIVLHHPYWRQGLATEAQFLCLSYGFDFLGLQRVDWFTSVANTYMRGWCEGMGMNPTEESHPHGPSVRYSIQQEDWYTVFAQTLKEKMLPHGKVHLQVHES